ncbi:hypothetical protein V498_00076 [Pseudogymnoascus sp. VKM F-4517 (FW-2822)]|nr:hypothetical protein V498_00076 [Pseudogymnoascus sp. VKM F-4517 (FW-2822)]
MASEKPGDIGHGSAVESTVVDMFSSDEEVVLSHNTSSLPPGYFTSTYFLGTMAASGFAIAGGVGGFALAAPILGIINADIGPDPNYVWISLVYTLTLAIGQTLVGRLSDLFGRRWFFISGNILALIGCIICAVATNIPMVIGGTTLIGLAASTQLSFTFVVGELVPMEYRFMANAFIYVWSIPFSGLGPLVAYAFVLHTKAGWRWCYYLMIIVNGLGALCWYFFYHPPTFYMKNRTTTRWEMVKNFDFVGFILFSGGLLIFLMGLSWGGGVYPWNSAHVITTLVVGFVACVAFVLWETMANPKEPLMPMHLFKDIGWDATIVLISLGASVYYAFSIIFPQMVFGLYTEDKAYGSALSCIVGASIVMGQIVGGLLSKWIGKQKWQLVVSTTAFTGLLGGVACATTDNKDTVIGLLIVGCFFVGWVESIGLAMSGIVIKDQSEIGTAVGIAGTVRSAVSTVASTIYVAILTNCLGATIPAQVPPALINAGLPASSVASFIEAMTTGSFEGIKGITPQITEIGVAAYKSASAVAYRTVFLSTIAFSGVALVLSFFCPNVDDKMTSMVATMLQKGENGEIVGAVEEKTRHAHVEDV